MKAPTVSVADLIRALSSDDALTLSIRAGAHQLNAPAFREAFLALGEVLRLRGILLVRLSREKILDELSTDVALILKKALNNARRSAATLDMERERVLARLRRAGVDAVLLKGGALRMTVYDDPAERSVGDVDLLIAHSEMQATSAALIEAGYVALDEKTAATYSKHHFHHAFRHPTGKVVEVHWALTAPNAPAQLSASAFIERSRVHQRANGPAIRIPCAEHMLLHLAVQNISEPQRIMSRAVDIDRIVKRTPAFDWEMTTGGARDGRFKTAFWFALHASQQLLGTKIPANALDSVRPSWAVRRHLTLINPFGRMLNAAPLRDGEMRVLQLWLLLGDHTARAATRWLLNQEFSDPMNDSGDDMHGSIPRTKRYRADALGLLINHGILYAAATGRALFGKL